MEKCLKVLALLNEINSSKEIVPYNAFYIHELTDQLDLEEDYRNWIEHREVFTLVFSTLCFVGDEEMFGVSENLHCYFKVTV